MCQFFGSVFAHLSIKYLLQSHRLRSTLFQLFERNIHVAYSKYYAGFSTMCSMAHFVKTLRYSTFRFSNFILHCFICSFDSKSFLCEFFFLLPFLFFITNIYIILRRLRSDGLSFSIPAWVFSKRYVWHCSCARKCNHNQTPITKSILRANFRSMAAKKDILQTYTVCITHTEWRQQKKESKSHRTKGNTTKQKERKKEEKKESYISLF